MKEKTPEHVKAPKDISELRKEALAAVEAMKRKQWEDYYKFLDSVGLKPRREPDDRFSCPPL